MSILLFYISLPAGSNFMYPTEDEDPPPPMEAGAEGGESIVPFGHTHESADALHRRYISTMVSSREDPDTDDSVDREFSGDGGYLSNMVSRWRGSDYESSEDGEYAYAAQCWYHRGH
jgi:hypothetical protein